MSATGLDLSNTLELLERLSSPDNKIRNSAEAAYEHYRKVGGDHLVIALLSVIRENYNKFENRHIMSLAAILLRRLTVQQEVSALSDMSRDGQQIFLNDLITLLRVTTDSQLRSRLMDLAGDIGGYVLSPSSDWPEILRYTSDCLKSPDVTEREIGINLIGTLANSCSSLFCTANYFPAILMSFRSTLSDITDNGKLAVSSLKSLAKLLFSFSQLSEWDMFEPLLDTIMDTYVKIVKQSALNEDCICTACSYSDALIEIAEENSEFFVSKLLLTFESIMTIVMAPEGSIHNTGRHMALELIVTLCANIPKHVRKLAGPDGKKGYVISRLFPVCAMMMTTIREDSSWVLAETIDDVNEGSEDADIGETAVDRMSVSLGLRATWPVVSQLIASLLSATPDAPCQWQRIHAGLRLLGNYLDVTKTIPQKSQLIEHRHDVINNIIKFSNYDHPRIRAATYYCIGQYIASHGESSSKDLLLQLLPILLHGMLAANNPAARVRRTSLVSLIGFIDITSAGVLQSHTGAILEKLAQSLQEGPLIVQELCVSGIASLAETMKGVEISRHYYAIMPILKQLVGYSKSHGLDVLWAQTVECCAMIGEASGKDIFLPDAMEMIQFLHHHYLSQQQSVSDAVGAVGATSEDMESKRLLLKAWVRIGRCLGGDFVPYLPIVVDQLTRSIAQDVSEKFIDLDELEERSDIEMVEGEDGWTAVRTAAVEEQASACQMMMLLVDKMQEYFFPFVEKTLTIMYPLTQSLHEDVRSFAVVSMPEFVRCVAKANPHDRAAVESVASHIIEILCNTVQKESVAVLIMTGLQALKSVIMHSCCDWNSASFVNSTDEPPSPTPATSHRWLSPQQLENLSYCARILLRESIQRRAVLKASAQVGGELDEGDEEDEQLFMQESMELHFNISEFLGTLLKTHSDSCMDMYSSIWHDTVLEMSHGDCLKEDKQFAFFVISDVVEFGISKEETAEEYMNAIMPKLLEGVVVPEANIRQTCSYTFGTMCNRFPKSFIRYANDVLMALARCVAMGEEPGEPRGQATDNAVASVGIILQRMSDLNVALSVDYVVMWRQWLQYLPLEHDKEENCNVFKRLADLLRSQNMSLLQSTDNFLSACVASIKVLDTELITTEVAIELIHTIRLLYEVKSSLTDTLTAFLSSHSDENLRNKFQWAMTLNISDLLSKSTSTNIFTINDVTSNI